MKVKIKKLTNSAKLPCKCTEDAAGIDFYADRMEFDSEKQTYNYHTGIAMEIPKGYAGLLLPRSSVSNTKLKLVNSIGLIDSDYRGEIIAKFNERMMSGKTYAIGERCCQMIIVPILNIELEEVNNLTDTKRGTGGFGSTGKS